MMITISKSRFILIMLLICLLDLAFEGDPVKGELLSFDSNLFIRLVIGGIYFSASLFAGIHFLKIFSSKGFYRLKIAGVWIVVLCVISVILVYTFDNIHWKNAFAHSAILSGITFAIVVNNYYKISKLNIHTKETECEEQ